MAKAKTVRGTSSKTQAATSTRGKPHPGKRLDAYRVIGPGGGGTMLGPVVSPFDPDTVVLRSDMTDGFITHDGGLSWREFNLRSGLNCFGVDWKDPKVIYAGNTALWRSRNGGKTYEMIWPDPQANTVEHMRTDDGDYLLSTADVSYPPLPGANISCINTDWSNNKKIFVGYTDMAYVDRHKAAGNVVVSDDFGATWKKLFTVPAETFHTIFPDGKALVAVGIAGVYRLESGQVQFLPSPSGKISRASVGRQGKTVLLYVQTGPEFGGTYAHCEGGFVSADAGKSWQNVSDSFFTQQNPNEGACRLTAVECCGKSANVLYVGFIHLRLGSGPENLFNGMAKSVDAGKTWQVVHKESTRHADNMLEWTFLEERAPNGRGNVWFDWPRGIGVAPGNPDVVYASDCFRCYGTKDGGKTWKQFTSVDHGNNCWESRGLDLLTCYGVHFDPFDKKHMFISYTDMGLHESHDGGTSWTSASKDISEEIRNTTYWLEFDPKVKDLVWAGFGGAHDLPRPRMWRQGGVERWRGGMGYSSNSGKTWTIATDGIPQAPVTHFLVDPTSPAGSRTLYACVFGHGLYKSTDNGVHWQLKANGITRQQPFAWRIVRAHDGTLYLLLARRSENGEIGNDMDGQLYRSTDGAESWTEILLPGGTNGPNGLAVHPKDTQKLFLAAWGRNCPGGDIGGGVFQSDDGGQTWRCIFRASSHCYDVTIDPKNPKVMYTAGFESAVHRTDDGGLTWYRLKGINFKLTHRVIPDPCDPSKIYVTSFGTSVWHGPAKGDAKAPEDISTPMLPKAP